MSTKIYEAYRCPASKLNEFIDCFRAHALKFTVKFIREYMSKLLPEAVAEYQKKHTYWKEPSLRFHKVMELCVEDSRRPEKGAFQLDCGLNIWLYRGKAYIIPICHLRGLLKGFKLPEWAEDYCYWNNTDEPEGVPYEEFKARGDMWEKINCGEGKADHNSRRLYHSVIDLERVSNYTDIGMLEALVRA
jgi:hypothetical protein